MLFGFFRLLCAPALVDHWRLTAGQSIAAAAAAGMDWRPIYFARCNCAHAVGRYTQRTIFDCGAWVKLVQSATRPFRMQHDTRSSLICRWIESNYMQNQSIKQQERNILSAVREASFQLQLFASVNLIKWNIYFYLDLFCVGVHTRIIAWQQSYTSVALKFCIDRLTNFGIFASLAIPYWFVNHFCGFFGAKI